MPLLCFRTTSRRAASGETDCRGVFNLNKFHFISLYFIALIQSLSSLLSNRPTTCFLIYKDLLFGVHAINSPKMIN